MLFCKKKARNTLTFNLPNVFLKEYSRNEARVSFTFTDFAVFIKVFLIRENKNKLEQFSHKLPKKELSIHAFFYKNNFIGTTRLKFAQKLRTN